MGPAAGRGARSDGIAISDNDLWIAATASTSRSPLVTCDRDHVRIAPELGVEVLFSAATARSDDWYLPG